MCYWCENGWVCSRGKWSFKMLGLTFSSKLDCTLTLSLLLKLPPRKLEPWFVLWSFFLLRLLSISVNLPYGHAWNTVVISGAPSCYLELIDKLQKWVCRTVSPSLAAFRKPLAHCQNVARLNLFYRYYFGRCSPELTQLVSPPYSRSSTLVDCIIFCHHS